MKTKILVGLSLVLIIFIAGCAQQSQNKTKLGFISPLTGWGAYWGVPEEQGIRLATEDIRKQYGDVIEIFVEDSKTTANDAVIAANKLISADNVDILYIAFTGPSSAVSPVAKQSKKVMIYDALPISIAQGNEYAFKMYFDAYEVCRVLTEEALERGKISLSVLTLKLDFSPPCKQAVRDATNRKNVTVEFYDVEYTETDFRTILLKMKEKKSDVIISYLYEDNALNLLKQIKEAGMQIALFCGGRHDCFTSRIVSEIGDIGEAVALDLQVNKEFRDRFKSINPEATDTDIEAAALSYDATFYMFLAAKDCKDLECTSSKLKSLNGKEFRQAVISTGFGKDRIHDLITKMYQFNGTDFEEIT